MGILASLGDHVPLTVRDWNTFSQPLMLTSVGMTLLVKAEL